MKRGACSAGDENGDLGASDPLYRYGGRVGLYILSEKAFAAGAMLYVVFEVLIPEMSSGEHSNIGIVFFAVGFSLMMALDALMG